jgi:hypothetical protein
MAHSTELQFPKSKDKNSRVCMCGDIAKLKGEFLQLFILTASIKHRYHKEYIKYYKLIRYPVQKQTQKKNSFLSAK